MSFSNRKPICSLKYCLQLFQAFGVYCMFAMYVITIIEEILADNISLKKLKYLLFYI